MTCGELGWFGTYGWIHSSSSSSYQPYNPGWVLAGSTIFVQASLSTVGSINPLKDPVKTLLSGARRLTEQHCLLLSRLCFFVLLVTATCRWRWVQSTGKMILTWVNGSSGRKICLCATLSTTNLIRTDLGSRPSTRSLSHDTAWRDSVKVLFYPMLTDLRKSVFRRFPDFARLSW